MASIEQRLARLEAQRPPASTAPDYKAEEARYGAPLWSMGDEGHRAYGTFREGLYWLTILDATGAETVTYVTAFDPEGGMNRGQ